jgi:hypothetical protein
MEDFPIWLKLVIYATIGFNRALYRMGRDSIDSTTLIFISDRSGRGGFEPRPCRINKRLEVTGDRDEILPAL